MVSITNKGPIHDKNFTTRNHGFSKGSTWLKCSHWLKRMSTLTKNMGHEKHMVFFIKMTILTKC